MKYQRLEDLRTDRDLTIRQVADYLGCNRDVYTRYEKGVRQLPISIAIRLAELYHPEKYTPATIEFVDIAGLVRGAVSGQSGLSGRHQR